jgi:hypothetical protein
MLNPRHPAISPREHNVNMSSPSEREVTRAVRRAGNLAAGATVLFIGLFWVSSEIESVRSVSPWADDPWDAVMSIAALVVPAVAAMTFIRAQRWRGDGPIPVAAHRLVLRGILVVLTGIAAATLAGIGATAGAGGVPWILALLLAFTAMATLVASGALVIAWHQLWIARGSLATPSSGRSPDLFDDMIVLARDILRLRQGPSGGLGAIARLDEFLARSRWSPRAHPTTLGVVVAIAFGSGFSTWHALAEGGFVGGGSLVVWAIYATIGAAIALCAYVGLGGYLRIVAR